MVKFVHLGDCHLGGWRQPELKELNLQSFQYVINFCIMQKVDFVLITGDLFDMAYPPVDTLKEVFHKFRKLKEANIPVFLISGSHDYSASGKTFLDVLEKAGFSKNVSLFEERQDKIILQPTLSKNVAIYGYPGKKSGLEVNDIEKIKLQDSPGFFKILMLHTAIRDAVGTLPIKAVNEKTLPKVDYIALGHLHINYNKENRVYSGPVFPNNISELEELKHGSFYIFDNGKISRHEIKLKEVLSLSIEIKDALNATEKILSVLLKESVKGKIILLKLYGILEKGKIADINFQKVESYLKEKEAYTFLRSTSKLHMAESEILEDIIDSQNMESEIIKRFEEKNPSKFNQLINHLVRSLQIEKHDDEKKMLFEERVISETRKILQL